MADLFDSVIRNRDITKVIELLAKLEGGQALDLIFREIEKMLVRTC